MANNNSYIGIWASILHRHRQSFLSKRLEPYHIGSGQQIFLLFLASKDGISQEELSAFVKLDKATTAKAIKKLENEGYVVRSIDAADKRAYQVSLTPKAMEVIPLIEAAVKDWEMLITTGFSQQERSLFEELLGKMARNVQLGS